MAHSSLTPARGRVKEHNVDAERDCLPQAAFREPRVSPFHLNEDWNLITRWITPVVYQPNVIAQRYRMRRRGKRPGRPESELLLIPGRVRQCDLGCRSNITSSHGNRENARPGEVGSRTLGGGVGAAGALDDRRIGKQHLVIRGRQDARTEQPVTASLFRQLLLSLAANYQLGAYYNLIHPLDPPYGKWRVRPQVAMLFPKAK